MVLIDISIVYKREINAHLYDSTFRQLIDGHTIFGENQELERKVYFCGQLVIDLDKNINDFALELVKNRPDVPIVVDEIWETKKFELSDNDFKRPIIDFLLSNNIKRACWTINGKWINVRNTFFNPGNKLVGYCDHKKGMCDPIMCDLITYYKKLNQCIIPQGVQVFRRIDHRCKSYDFRFITSDYSKSCKMNVPVIANRKAVIQLFLNMEGMTKEHSLMDFDLYFIKRYTYDPAFENKEPIYKKIINNDEFVIDFFQKNLCPMLWNAKRMYVIVEKISKCLYDFLAMRFRLPKDLTNLICGYCDFESESRPFDWKDILTDLNEKVIAS